MNNILDFIWSGKAFEKIHGSPKYARNQQDVVSFNKGMENDI